MFDSFWQADPSSTRRYGGTGLGTAIARDLTRLMGGVIGVESEEGQGQHLPGEAAVYLAGHPGATRAAEVLRGVTALVFEQHEQSARAIVEVCEAAGMQPEVVSHIDQLGAAGERA